MNLRSQDSQTNNVDWSVDTQYFINDVVRGADGGLYVYEAWDGTDVLASSVLGGVEPSSAGGPAAGWAPAQGVGLKNVIRNTAAVTGFAGGATGVLGATAGLTATIAPAGGLGVVSTWLVKLDYLAQLNAGATAFASTEWVNWTVTANGAGATASSTHVFGEGNGLVASGGGSSSPCSVVIVAPADATTLTVSGFQSLTSVLLTFPNSVAATFSRLK
jgi:hypothetical protein